jgi:adenylate cyclase
MNALAGIPELRVAARTSAFSFRGDDATVAEIGKVLNVAHVIEGSVRRFGDRIRITVQLIDARTDTHLWSQTYDRDFVDVFDIQDEIARTVVDLLRLNLLGQIPAVKRANPEAYPLYLQARYILNGQFDDEDSARAVQLLERALEIDPNFADALSILARARWLDDTGDSEAAERHARVRTMIDRGFALAPDNGALLGWKSFLTAVLDNDLYTAARYFKRAHEVDPTNYELIWGGVLEASLYGRPEIGIELGNYLIARDPLCLGCYGGIAENYLEIGDYEAAEAILRRGLALQSDYIGLQVNLGQVLLLQGRAEEALEVFTHIRQYEEKHSGSYEGYPGHLEALHQLGRTEEFDALLPVFLEFHEREGYNLLIAQLYAWLGEADLAFEWLAKHDREMTWNIRDHLRRPWYRKIHDDPRWQALLAQYQMTRTDIDAINLTIRMPPDDANLRE